MRIWFHGTDKEAADIIMKDGFRDGTCFAAGLQDALQFGGPYVFDVILRIDQENTDMWQVYVDGEVVADQIVGLKKFDELIIYDNSDARNELFQRALAKDGDGDIAQSEDYFTKFFSHDP